MAPDVSHSICMIQSHPDICTPHSYKISTLTDFKTSCYLSKCGSALLNADKDECKSHCNCNAEGFIFRRVEWFKFLIPQMHNSGHHSSVGIVGSVCCLPQLVSTSIYSGRACKTMWMEIDISQRVKRGSQRYCCWEYSELFYWQVLLFLLLVASITETFFTMNLVLLDSDTWVNFHIMWEKKCDFYDYRR